MSFELIVGPPRCGKSRLAEERASASSVFHEPGLYIGTLAVIPDLWQRIHTHRARRGSSWQTVEIVRHLDEAVSAATTLKGRRAVLLDGISNYAARRVAANRVMYAAPRSRELIEECIDAVRRLALYTDYLFIVGTTVPREEAIDPWKRNIQDVNALLLAQLAAMAATTTVLAGHREGFAKRE